MLTKHKSAAVYNLEDFDEYGSLPVNTDTNQTGEIKREVFASSRLDVVSAFLSIIGFVLLTCWVILITYGNRIAFFSATSTTRSITGLLMVAAPLVLMIAAATKWLAFQQQLKAVSQTKAKKKLYAR